MNKENTAGKFLIIHKGEILLKLTKTNTPMGKSAKVIKRIFTKEEISISTWLPINI